MPDRPRDARGDRGSGSLGRDRQPRPPHDSPRWWGWTYTSAAEAPASEARTILTNGERSLVVLPAHGVAASLAPLVREVRAAVPRADVLIVCAPGQDDTPAMADTCAAQDMRHVFVLHGARHHGRHAACLAGLWWGMEHHYDYLAEMRTDGAHSPADLPRLFEALRGADTVLGAPPRSDGSRTAADLLTRAAEHWMRHLLDVPAHALSSDMRAFRASTLRDVPIHHASLRTATLMHRDLAWLVIADGGKPVTVAITEHLPQDRSLLSAIAALAAGRRMHRTRRSSRLPWTSREATAVSKARTMVVRTGRRGTAEGAHPTGTSHPPG